MSKRKFPPLSKLTDGEAECIASAFKLYDYKSNGRVPTYLAVKLIQTLGLPKPPEEIFGAKDVTLNEVLVVIDRLMPEPEPVLNSSLESFINFAAVKDHESKVINPNSIAEFMESLGRPPINMNEASLMLNSMLEYDDCAEVPIVNIDVFSKELINFAKKSNAFKEYRG
jgi:hypothetical protein